MMRRYYYDCPVMAVYMAKYFGIKMQCRNLPGDEGIEYANGEEFFDFVDSDIAPVETVKDLLALDYSDRGIYIHPESHGLLAALDTDFVKITPECDVNGELEGELIIQWGDRKVKDNWMHIIKHSGIVERNGLLFFWPKERS